LTDRMKEPWAEHTPFGQGEEWPVRVDQFLEQGISEDDIDRWVQTASILHSNGDALDIAVKEGRIVGVRGRGVDRVNKGRVDPKDLFGWQANNAGDRLRKPLVRENGELVEASWGEAMGRIVERSQELLEEKRALAFGFYTTGQLFLEEYYTLGVIGKAGTGTPHMDGNTRLCTATAAEALKQTFGTDGQPGSYADVDHADTICLYGHNVAETQAVLWMRMLDRLEGRQPPKLVVVDPRPTPPALRADVHLRVRNGTNLALMNGLLHEMISNGWYDEEYVAAHTMGFEELKNTVAEYTEMEHKAIAPAGRAFLLAAEYQPPHEEPREEYPFSYITGRTIYHFHTRTKTARAPQLQNAAPDVWVELSPADAESLGVEEGDMVRVESPRGQLEAKARISGIKEGVVFAPFHYGYFDEPDGQPRAANELTITEWDPASKQPLYKIGAVRVTKVADARGTPAPAPTTTASAPTSGVSVPETVGGEVAEVEEIVGKE
jgi:anaerobic selenocysteine-containing dehydrogenase